MPALRPEEVVTERVVVPAETTCGAVIAATGLPTAGPGAIVVVRLPDRTLKDLDWVPDTDVEVEPVAILERIELRMREIIKARQRFQRRVFPSVDAARTELAAEPYKLELIDVKSRIDPGEAMELGGGDLTVYDNIDPRTGQTCWSDLCRGPICRPRN